MWYFWGVYFLERLRSEGLAGSESKRLSCNDFLFLLRELVFGGNTLDQKYYLFPNIVKCFHAFVTDCKKRLAYNCKKRLAYRNVQLKLKQLTK